MNPGSDTEGGGRTTAMCMGQVFRDGRPKSNLPVTVDEHVNLYAATYLSGARLIPFESGINPIARVKAPEGPRVPAILVASSPHKVGSSETPWQDQFDVDNGRIRYYGDNRTPGRDPATTPGNKALLAAHARHAQNDPAERSGGVPLLFFRRVPHAGRAKGFVRFEGAGIVTRVELVAQYSARAGGTFANFAFDFLVFDVSREAETIDWRWINHRRDPNRGLQATLEHAPYSWKRWITAGMSASDPVRRRVSRLLVQDKSAQLPQPGTPEARILGQIYDYFRQGKHHLFEALAQTVAQRVIAPGSDDYLIGGLTRATADQGIDFIGRLDIGSGFGRAKLVVLGQAKCEKPSRGTNANDIARTVARLRRGWLGVYVTTSFFTPNAQREVIEDRYPIVLIGGLRLAEEVRAMLIERGADGTEALDGLLREVDEAYAPAVVPRDPEELLLQ
jgi:hypothetical protein